MPAHDVNLADRSGSLVESHKGYDPRLVLFYPLIAVLLLVLVGGLAYQQLFRTDAHADAERKQNQRRILVPGPRGNIYDRNGQLLVTNKARFSVVLYLDELKRELRKEHVRIHNRYLAAGATKKDFSYSQLEHLARISVVQGYLDQINRFLHRTEQVDAERLSKHFRTSLLLPFPLLDDLKEEEYARLIERLPVRSPLQVYTFNARYYPFESTAAHTLGYVRSNDDIDTEDFPGNDLKGPRQKGTIGKDGLEKQYDDLLQGDAGFAIIRVDPAGFRIDSPDLPHRLPKQGKDLTTSLDIDLQQTAEEAMAPKDKPDLAQTGAAVAIDVATGEVLVLASMPNYNLNDWYPRLSPETYRAIQEKGAEFNRAVNGFYPPGSTFKIVTSIAGLRRGVLPVDQPIVECAGYLKVGNKLFPCEVPPVHHGELLLPDAIARSCEIFFYKAGELTTPEALAAEAKRFHLDRRTGIELPGESGRMIVPDPEWKQRVMKERWFPGDTALTATGQGFVQFSPLQMACFAASVARGEVWTQPTLLHDPNRPPQHTEPIGLTPAQRQALIEGMFRVTQPPKGTARSITELEAYRVPGVRIGGKTGTAQKDVFKDGKHLGKINLAWFICFAPIEKPEIAVAVIIEGDTPGEEFGGGRYAAPVAARILQKYFEKKSAPPRKTFVSPFKS